MTEEETITISKTMYNRLLLTLNDSVFLKCLKECGVDNWEGYSDAYQLYCYELDK